MTYILGAKCIDGVVLIGDRKVTTEQGYVEYCDKLFNDPSFAVVGSSGILGIFNHFRTRVTHYLNTISPDQRSHIPVYDFILKLEDITYELNTRYNQRDARAGFDVLIGLQTTTGALLRYVNPNGIEEPVNAYQAIGSGTPYGEIVMRPLWNTSLTMEQVAKIGYFIIHAIENWHLDNFVGVGDSEPQIYFIPNSLESPIRLAPQTTIAGFRSNIESMYTVYREMLMKLFTLDASS